MQNIWQEKKICFSLTSAFVSAYLEYYGHFRWHVLRRKLTRLKNVPENHQSGECPGRNICCLLITFCLLIVMLNTWKPYQATQRTYYGQGYCHRVPRNMVGKIPTIQRRWSLMQYATRRHTTEIQSLARVRDADNISCVGGVATSGVVKPGYSRLLCPLQYACSCLLLISLQTRFVIFVAKYTEHQLRKTGPRK